MKNNTQETQYLIARLNLTAQNGDAKRSGPAIGEGAMGQVAGSVGGAITSFMDAVPQGGGLLVGGLLTGAALTAAGIAIGGKKNILKGFSKKSRNRSMDKMTNRMARKLSEKTFDHPIYTREAQHNPAEDLEHVVLTTKRGGKTQKKEGDLAPAAQ
jgi:hypothetical protein